MEFVPQFTLDLPTASSKAFQQFLEDLEKWRREEPQRDIDLSNGWKVITPEIAEAMLLRNPIGANRRPTLPTVKYYARQMLSGNWKKTGQPLLFNTEGRLLDSAHRLLACYLSGASFPTYLVGDVPVEPNLFAYIDNAKSRTAADALATAGLNGLAKSLTSVINMAMHFEHGCYTPSNKRTLEKITPIEVVQYAEDRPNLRQAVRLVVGEYKAAATLIGYRDVAAFVAYQILDLYDEDTLDEFMTDVGRDREQVEEGSAVAALQKVMADDERSNEPMAKHQVLGYVIKAFNAFISREPVKRLTLKVNEPFPQFAHPAPAQQAAE
jgi:hypothetical protein